MAVEYWRLLQHDAAPGAWNMAVDEILLEEAMKGAKPVLRLYSWRPYALSLGHFQQGDVVDKAACAQAGVDVVRRPTGGRAVLHANEVTYSIILPPSHPLTHVSVVASYQALSQGLLRGLALLGIQAQLARVEHPPTPAAASVASASDGGAQAACFDAPSWYELLANGRKLVGSAQVRRGGALLQHGSVPLTLVPQDLYKLLSFSSAAVRERAQQAFANKAAGLCDITAQSLTPAHVAQALISGISQALSCIMQADQLTPKELEQAETLAQKHAHPQWVWYRTKV
jgi:lipoate-protein ligase A